MSKQKFKFENTFVGKIFVELEKLEVGETICKKTIVAELYGYFDLYTRRTFDVAFTYARKENVSRKYKTRSFVITRVK